jgi:hypothetical protein
MSFDTSSLDSEIFGVGEEKEVPVSLGGYRSIVELDYKTFLMLFGTIAKKGYDVSFKSEHQLTGTLPSSFRDTRKLQGKIVGFSKAMKTMQKIEEQQLFSLKFETSIKIIGKPIKKEETR